MADYGFVYLTALRVCFSFLGVAFSGNRIVGLFCVFCRTLSAPWLMFVIMCVFICVCCVCCSCVCACALCFCLCVCLNMFSVCVFYVLVVCLWVYECALRFGLCLCLYMCCVCFICVFVYCFMCVCVMVLFVLFDFTVRLLVFVCV